MNPETEATLRGLVPCPVEQHPVWTKYLTPHSSFSLHHPECPCHGSGEVPRFPALWMEHEHCHGTGRFISLGVYVPCDCWHGLVFAPTLDGALKELGSRVAIIQLGQYEGQWICRVTGLDEEQYGDTPLAALLEALVS